MSAPLFAASPEDLQELVGEVWSSHVDDFDELLPAAPHQWLTPSGDSAVPCWSGAVSVSGGWQGLIAIDLADQSARALGRGMLGLAETEELDTADLCDAVGEFANIVGGNVKSLMPGPSTLSLPVVAHTVLETPSELRARLTLDLAWRDSPVRIRVLAHPGRTPLTVLQEVTP
jgi:chemotaxis protein CheX